MASRVMRGIVREGDHRGRALGFPTANMRLHRPLPEGVYISVARVRGREHHALTFIGAPKTFHRRRRVETHILDFSKMIYGEWVSVRILKKIRGNKKFFSVAALVRAMRQDERIARRYFKQS